MLAIAATSLDAIPRPLADDPTALSPPLNTRLSKEGAVRCPSGQRNVTEGE